MKLGGEDGKLGGEAMPWGDRGQRGELDLDPGDGLEPPAWLLRPGESEPPLLLEGLLPPTATGTSIRRDGGKAMAPRDSPPRRVSLSSKIRGDGPPGPGRAPEPALVLLPLP